MQEPQDRTELRVRQCVQRALAVNATRVHELAPGLGLRRFFRVETDGEPSRLVARVEQVEDAAGRPAGAPPEPPLEPVRRLLERAGLPVPARLGASPDGTIELLEDLGSCTLEEAARAAGTEERRRLYRCALACLPVLQRIESPEPPIAAFQRQLDATLIAYKADLFATWSLPAALGRPARAAEQAVVREAFAWIAERVAEAPRRLAHRDFQSRNLIVRPGPDGTPGVWMIDLQGAFLAPPEYDAVCLLRDSYVELPGSELREHLDFLRPALPDAPDPATFAQRFDLLTLVRKGKDHARFLFAASQRDDGRFLAYLPATVRSLHAAAARSAALDAKLARLAELVAGLSEEAVPCAP